MSLREQIPGCGWAPQGQAGGYGLWQGLAVVGNGWGAISVISGTSFYSGTVLGAAAAGGAGVRVDSGLWGVSRDVGASGSTSSLPV